MPTVAVIDYGMGNLHSVAKALEHVAPEARVVVTGEAGAVRAADRIVFPGQGAIGQAMEALARSGLDEVVRGLFGRRPFLGICLGLQALMRWSEEDGGTAGLGLLPGEVRRFPHGLREPATGTRLKIPHMGWNRVHQELSHPLWEGIGQDERFYFVHSYHVALEPAPGRVAATADYGLRFAAAVAGPAAFAVQFHPEKSQRAGLRLLANFARWDGEG